jgi:anaerobic selenocysteine-containing dehydrogenase
MSKAFENGGRAHLDIHPIDAAKRGTENADQVRIYNERGSFVAAVRDRRGTTRLDCRFIHLAEKVCIGWQECK